MHCGQFWASDLLQTVDRIQEIVMGFPGRTLFVADETVTSRWDFHMG